MTRTGSKPLVFVCAFALTLTGRLAADASQRRDTRGEADALGTSSISGVVRTAESATRPVRGAVLRLSGATRQDGRLEVSDGQGRFTFGGLRAGRYTVSASKPGLVTTFSGSTRPGRGPGIPIAIGSGQTIDDIRVSMPRGAVIAGRVLDYTGRPQRNAIVSVIDAQAVGREINPAPSATARTDDRGEYRIFGLAPGAYIVAVQPGFSFNGADRPTAPDIGAVLRQAKSGLSPTASLTAPVELAYAPTVYPGSTDLSRGEPIRLSTDEERTGIDVRLELVRTARLQGRVVSQDGRPVRGLELGLVWPGQRLGLTEMSYPGTSPLRATLTAKDGAFSRPALVPGHYTILARAQDGTVPDAAAGPALWAIGDFDATGAPLPDVVLSLQPGATMSGRIAFEGRAPLPADLTQVELRLVPASSGGLTLAPRPVRARADGTFALRGIPRGQFTLLATLAGQTPSPWRMESASLDGQDLLESTVVVNPPLTLSGALVTFTDTPTTVSGTLVDALGRPAPDFVVLAFPVDRARWTGASRRIQTGRPATDGQYSIAGLPPGEYYIGAVAELDAADLTDASFLESVAAMATRVTVAAHELRRLDLELGR